MAKEYYRNRQSEIRDEAIDFQNWLSENEISWGGLFEAQCYFEEMGKRYGLLREFHENGIC